MQKRIQGDRCDGPEAIKDCPCREASDTTLAMNSGVFPIHRGDVPEPAVGSSSCGLSTRDVEMDAEIDISAFQVGGET